MPTPVTGQPPPSTSLLLVITYSMNPIRNMNLPRLRRLSGIRLTALVDRRRLPEFDRYERFFDRVYYIDIEYRDHCFIDGFSSTAEHVVAGELALCGRLFVMSFCEGDIEATAELRARFNLPGMSPGGAAKFRDKMVMKRIAGEHHGVPRAVVVDWGLSTDDMFSVCSDVLGIPFIVKPTGLCGSLGVAEVSAHNEFDAIGRQRLAGDYMAEERVLGDLLHLDVVVSGGTIAWFGCSQYNVPLDRFVAGSAVGSMPLLPGDHWHRRLRNYASSIVQSFSVRDSILHIEVFRRGDEVLFLEAAARPAGGLIPLVYEKMFGYNMYQAALEYRAGLNYAPSPTDGHSYFWLLLPEGNASIVAKLGDAGIPFELHAGGNGKKVSGSLIGTYDRLLAFHDDYRHLYRAFMALA